MKTMMHGIGSVLLVVALFVGCGGDDEIDQLTDCAQICNRFDTCVREIDVSACTRECEDAVDADPTVADLADECERCVSDVSCSEAEVCWANCPVVPLED